MNEKITALSQMTGERTGYPDHPPFFPNAEYPELKKLNIELQIDNKNYVYETVRNALIFMGLDKKNIGTENWNPLSGLINKGDMVVLKPNFVLDKNINDETSFSTITHASVIRVIIDYAILALDGVGKIIVADAPQMNCDYERLIEKNGMKDVAEYYKQQLKNSEISFELIDLRREMTIYKYGIVWKRIALVGDPRGYTIVDLKNDSEFRDLDPENFYGADYNRAETIAAHSDGHHKYFLSNTILQSDVIISMPKLKVHRKVGVTLNLKNMVGINGNKNYLVHYRVGTKSQGGDEFSVENKISKLDRKIKDKTLGRNWHWGKYFYLLYIVFKRLFRVKEVTGSDKGGDWWGNDTTWRMTLDLNRILLYSDKKGELKDYKKRRYLSVIDGIIGGEGDGPLQPVPVKSGTIIAGINPVATDIVATTFMGIDYTKIRSLNEGNIQRKSLIEFEAENIEVFIDDTKSVKITDMPQNAFKFKVPNGWKDYL